MWQHTMADICGCEHIHIHIHLFMQRMGMQGPWAVTELGSGMQQGSPTFTKRHWKPKTTKNISKENYINMTFYYLYINVLNV